MSRPQMRSCRGPWIGLVVRVEQIAARYKWTIPVTFQIPWGTMPPMPSTVTIRGSSTGEPLAISILQQSPLILTQVRFLNYMILSIDSISLIWNIITNANDISSFCSTAGHGSCKFEFLPWIKFEAIYFLAMMTVMKSLLFSVCVS